MVDVLVEDLCARGLVTVDHVDYGAAWRQRDYDVITSPEFKKLIEDNHVILIKWKDLKKLLN